MASIKSYFSLILLAASWMPLHAQMTVTISPSVPSPALIGTPVTWTIGVSGANPGVLAYRFRVRHEGPDFHTLVDYGPKTSLVWTTIQDEGLYAIEGSVKNLNSGATASGSVTFRFEP